ncbi:hypothetical protein NC797_11670 [Aquibacillus sp. 3ASR75-11]|uniref:Uncharacterized protein n=1 Tax=Terrihalobacillus insolitus TaxID=2950438 RepID=A0A9X3WST1_9BACI|nr:hypothetical protein [Terrihalobacillus insolitus]MDC3413178.1 hypothetical protein [Terrihalobacillus insolitus]MDC3425162.1 hypothetical protein [Terrihalobacillus insolitus]
MQGKDLLKAIDYKKLTIVELQLKIKKLREKYPEKKKLIYVTHSAIIEADFEMELAENLEEEPLIGRAIQEYELYPEIDIKDKRILNTSA